MPMKAKELRTRTLEELERVAASLRDELFQFRFQNHTNRLDNTSQLRKTRRDLARVLTVLSQKRRES
jgi:large subunit ribosomal protein L29